MSPGLRGAVDPGPVPSGRQPDRARPGARRGSAPIEAAAALREPPAEAAPLPLVVDLDRLLPADGLGQELALRAARGRPTRIARLLLGRSGVADEAIGDLGPLDLTGILPAGPELRAIEAAHRAGHDVKLLTATHPGLARHLGRAYPWISEVIVAPAGDGLAELATMVAIRAACPGRYLVLPGQRSEAAWSRTAPTFTWPGDAEPLAATAEGPGRPALWAEALRLHQWTKNLLVFPPLVLAGLALDATAWGRAALAFLAFGFVASATYLVNDLRDLPHDRLHRSKRHRPIASGRLPIRQALLGSLAGLAGGFALAAAGAAAAGMPTGAPMAVLSAYLVATVAYTFAIKRWVLLDAVTLAGLFTLRLLAGIAFCGITCSPWLLAFSMFIFTSLALAKRMTEIGQLPEGPDSTALPGRGYQLRDGPVVLALGAATATAATVILALYIVDAPARQAFYVHPEALWLAPAALFLWLGRIWILCGRGELHDDPVEFAIRDRASLALGFAVLSGFVLACLRL